MLIQVLDVYRLRSERVNEIPKGGVVWCRKRSSEMSAGIDGLENKEGRGPLGNRKTGKLACTRQRYRERKGTQETMKAGKSVSDIWGTLTVRMERPRVWFRIM